MTDTTKKVIEVGKASDEQLAAWKLEHKIVNEFVLEVSETEKSFFYTRKHKRQHAEEGYKIVSTSGFLASGTYLLDSLFIGGDSRVLSDADEDVDIRVSACHLMASSVELLKGEVIKN